MSTEGSGGGNGGFDDADAPLLPSSYSENDLREAVGAKPVRDPVQYSSEMSPVASGVIENPPLPAPQEYPLSAPVTQEPSYATAPAAAAPPPPAPKRAKQRARDLEDDAALDSDSGPRKSRKPVAISAIAIIVGLAIAALIFLGRANSEHYALRCEPDLVIAEQGRSFPPWGARELAGAEWKAIAIPPEAECKPRETDNPEELAAWFLGLLVDQASTLLTAREVTKVDLAEQDLKQGLLLARSPDRRDQRKEIERLLGDVAYWRALATLRDATGKLGDAAKQFEAAAAQLPRHVSDAAAWASYIRKVADELHVGPAGAHQPAFPGAALPLAERPSAPAGVALPVEPDRSGSVPPVAPVATPPDAGAPSGGVLL